MICLDIGNIICNCILQLGSEEEKLRQLMAIQELLDDEDDETFNVSYLYLLYKVYTQSTTY